jgi:hypothetical protein
MQYKGCFPAVNAEVAKSDIFALQKAIFLQHATHCFGTNLSSVLPASITCWQGGSTAGPSHYRP